MKPSLGFWQIAVRSLRFYWRTQASVFLGTTIAAAVLVGGMLVGDCVTYSLRRAALLRLGKVHAAMHIRGRFFHTELASRLEKNLATPSVPALILPGVVLTDGPGDDPIQVNRVQIIGVDSRFWQLAPDATYTVDGENAAINQKLAAELKIKEGAEISVRVNKPSLLPRDAPLAARNEKYTRRGLFTVRHVVSGANLGRFGLAANQIAPYNVFVDITWLQRALDLPERANALLLGDTGTAGKEDLAAALKKSWTLRDVGIAVRERKGVLQLESDRIFLDPATSSSAMVADPNAVGALAYLVNSIRKGERSTPYSFAVAVAPSTDTNCSLVPMDMRDDQVLINQWLADQLGAKAGDSLTIAYYEMAPDGKFVERERLFTVYRVDSMARFAQERDLLPAFPGLTDVDRCREWDIGMPMDKEALKDAANEDYWKRYKATPKAIVTLKAGREMWSNRFGNTSAIRFSASNNRAEQLTASLQEELDPGAMGLFLLPVREQALRAVDEAMNFGELFLAMSFFLIVAALLLTGMLFVFGIQQRAEEMGVLLGVGWRPGQVRRLFLWDGGLIALLGSIVGGLLGMAYTRALIWGLATHWRGAVANAAIQYHVEPGTFVMGVCTALGCALLAMLIAMWRQSRRPARELLAGDFTGSVAGESQNRSLRWTLLLSLTAFLLALATVGFAMAGSEEHRTYTFFGAGFLLLLAGLGFSRMLLRRFDNGHSRRLSIAGMGIRNTSRRSGRSLTAVALLACGCFLVFAVSAMQQDLAAFAHERWSGTGGFSLFAESTLPLPDPLESEDGRKQYGFDREAVAKGTTFVSIKVRDGDDASCFNLNRAQSPRLLGIDPEAFTSRKAFMGKAPADNKPWELLAMDLPDNVIPGLVGDANTAMWNLQKKVSPEKGDEIDYKDEHGRSFKVRLVGKLPMPLSIFQGTILIAKSDFMERYPSESGYRMFLADVPQNGDKDAVQRAMARRFQRIGLDATPSLTRLNEFHSVEATYLNMFLVLGGLGMVLGALGLGIVVLRNVLERRSELAILRSVGYTRRQVLWLVLAEHWLLLVLGLACGLVSALLAILPILLSPGMHIPYATVAALVVGVVVAGFGSTALAAHLAMRGELIPSLRQE